MSEPLLPGGAERPRSGGNGQFVAVVVIAVIVVAVIGVLVGALWGRSGTDAGPARPATPGAPTTPAGPTPDGAPTTPGPDRSPTSPTPYVTPTTPSGEFPPAPASSQQVSKKWAVGNWRITNTGGVIGMQATVTNRAAKTRSGELTMYLYVDGVPLARLGAVVTDVPAGASLPVTFTSDDTWGPGTKTLLLVAS